MYVAYDPALADMAGKVHQTKYGPYLVKLSPTQAICACWSWGAAWRAMERFKARDERGY